MPDLFTQTADFIAPLLHLMGDGVPTALLCIPLRNMHSPVETLDLKDIERCGRLLAHFICALDEDFVDYLSLMPPADDEAN